MEYWTGYKLHADVNDCGLPVSIVLTAASVLDSQVAIPTAVVMNELDHVHPLIVDTMPSNFFSQSIKRARSICLWTSLILSI